MNWQQCLRDANTLTPAYLLTPDQWSRMADEEKYRIEAQDEDEKKEKKGLFRPLPQVEKEYRTTSGKRPQPIVRLLGITMTEKKRDLILVVLMPFLTAVMDTSIFSLIIMHFWENSAVYMFLIPALAAIPIGLVVSETGQALIAGFLSAIFFMILFVFFLITPALMFPQLNLSNFVINGIAVAVGYFILVVVAGLLGAVIGTVLREFA
jgi:hypothetical protein